MDLSRWGFRKISLFTARARGFHQLVGDVLDGEKTILPNASVGHEVPVVKFEVQSDFSDLPRILKNARDESEICFSLAPYFEAGFFLHADLDYKTARLHSVFIAGKTYRLARS